MNPSEKNFIFDAMSKNCLEISKDKHGCCVIQKSIQFANESQRVMLFIIIIEGLNR